MGIRSVLLLMNVERGDPALGQYRDEAYCWRTTPHTRLTQDGATQSSPNHFSVLPCKLMFQFASFLHASGSGSLEALQARKNCP
eukprot:6490840-Amphidinium_carterae.2